MSQIKTKSSFGVAQLILFLSIAILVVVVAFPVLLILFNAFWVEDHFNFDGAIMILQQPATYQALKNSLIIAAMSTIGSTIVGTFFAWLVTRTDLPHKKFMKAMFLVPFMLPSFIGAMAWKMLLSPNAGFINQFFMHASRLYGTNFQHLQLSGHQPC
jgi:iron(III) transport system permease protein